MRAFEKGSGAKAARARGWARCLRFSLVPKIDLHRIERNLHSVKCQSRFFIEKKLLTPIIKENYNYIIIFYYYLTHNKTGYLSAWSVAFSFLFSIRAILDPNWMALLGSNATWNKLNFFTFWDEIILSIVKCSNLHNRAKISN